MSYLTSFYIKDSTLELWRCASRTDDKHILETIDSLRIRVKIVQKNTGKSEKKKKKEAEDPKINECRRCVKSVGLFLEGGFFEGKMSAVLQSSSS
ncbi:hypothetical protein EYF80_038664 [Liparis tanakae]|uniref:Uncharacterized protein n=1 Tax=Liparis tanakae TaxID=230148 RepID=A0A4Z2GE16_9TELE|nr:hypothetical protein EYF80_038664 [Liparis tanakae]